MARRPVPARKGSELVDQAGAIARSAALDEVALQRIAADARQLMNSDAAGAHMVLGIVAAVRGDAARVRKHYGIALGLDRSAVTWFNYSMSLAAVDEHSDALAVARKGLVGHPDDAALTDRAAEAALESGRFMEAEELCRRRERLNAEGAYRWRDEVRQLSAAVESGTMTETGASAVIELMTKVQREAGASTVGLDIRRDGAGAFLYDRYVRCSPKIASGMNWSVTGEIVDRQDLHSDPGRAFLVGFVGVADGSNA